MNFNKTIMAASILAVASTVANEATGAEIISRPDFKVVDGKMTPELMEAFGRVTDPQVSPDKKKILYNVEFISLKADKGNKELWTMNIDGSNPQKSPTPQKARLALFGSKTAQRLRSFHPPTTECSFSLWIQTEKTANKFPMLKKASTVSCSPPTRQRFCSSATSNMVKRRPTCILTLTKPM